MGALVFENANETGMTALFITELTFAIVKNRSFPLRPVSDGQALPFLARDPIIQTLWQRGRRRAGDGTSHKTFIMLTSGPTAQGYGKGSTRARRGSRG